MSGIFRRVFPKRRTGQQVTHEAQNQGRRHIGNKYEAIGHILTDLVTLGAYNVTIGNDGSVEFVNDFEVISKGYLCHENPVIETLSWIIDRSEKSVPQPLKAPNPEIDIAIYTFKVNGTEFGFDNIPGFAVGLYCPSASAEALQKNGYIVFRTLLPT